MMRPLTPLERQQKNLTIIKTSLLMGTLMFMGFAYLMFNLMGIY